MCSEIIEVVERRRRWPIEVRLKVLDEVLQPGASVAAVADRHGVARGLIYQWLPDALARLLAVVDGDRS
jgi:transposase